MRATKPRCVHEPLHYTPRPMVPVCHIHDRCDVAKSYKLAGLIAFAVIALLATDRTKRWFASIIFVNGILCHMTSCGSIWMQWDVTWNGFMMAYVLLTTTRRREALYLGLLMTVSFAANCNVCRGRSLSGWSGILHVMLVQMAGAIALARYRPRRLLDQNTKGASLPSSAHARTPL